MLTRILLLSLLSTTGYANVIDCASGNADHQIAVEINPDHDTGMLNIDGQHLSLRCTKDNQGLELVCHAFRATTVYTVKIHRNTHSRRLWEHKGHIDRILGGFTGSIYTDLGELHCAEWPEGSFPH